MVNKNLTRLEISDTINKEIGISRSESSYFVDNIVNEMTKALVDHKLLKISSFGTLKIRFKKARIGRNPKTGEDATISSRNIVSFIPSKTLKNKINNN
tara:strand:+ start:193 stop:486 length:294 start_codon:yes stop_codon:yes gene_type:complete